MNLLDIKAQSLSALKLPELKEIASQFNIAPVGDLRLKDTWINAIQAAQSALAELAKETIEGAAECIEEALTYDNVVIAANAIAVWSRKSAAWTVKTLWSAALVSIALISLAIDLWKERKQVKAETILIFSKAHLSLQCLIEEFKYEVGNAFKKIGFEYRFLRFHGKAIFQSKVIRSIAVHREQVNAIAKAVKA